MKNPKPIQYTPTAHFFNPPVNNAATFSYTVKTIPPLSTNLPSLIVLPLQNPLIPLSLHTDVAASTVPWPFAPCALVLIVSNGCVAYTVIVPATAPVANVTSWSAVAEVVWPLRRAATASLRML